MPKPGEALEALIRDKTIADMRFARIMLSAQRKLLSDLASDLREIDELVDDYRRQGITPDPWLLMRQDRTEQMLRQYEQYLAALDDAAHRWKAHPTNTITGLLDLSRDEILAAVSQANAAERVRITAEQAFQSFDTQGMLALLTDQSTQRAEALFQSVASEFTRDQLRNELFSGFGQGRSIKDTLRAIEPLVSEPRSRLATIVRTETMRAQREALRQSYTDSTVTEGWRWFATGDQRTCFLCLSQHGTIHPLDEPMNSHPNCRCVMLPELKSFADLGLDPSLDDLTPDTDVVNETGADLLARMTPEERRQILGPTRAAALEDGRIGLDDLWTLERNGEYTNLRAVAIDELPLGRPAATEVFPDGDEALAAIQRSTVKLSVDHQAYLDLYTTGPYAGFNRWLRGIDTPEERVLGAYNNMASRLDDLLEAQKPLDSPITLWRGVDATEMGDWINGQIGDVLTDPGFFSTSVDRSVADWALDIVGGRSLRLRIEVPRGAKGLNVPELQSANGPYAWQREFVLPRGSRFRIVARGENELTLRLLT